MATEGASVKRSRRNDAKVEPELPRIVLRGFVTQSDGERVPKREVASLDARTFGGHLGRRGASDVSVNHREGEITKAFEDRLSEREAFEALLIESAERALRKYARWTSGDEHTIARAALPNLDVLKVLVSDELTATSEANGARLRVDVPFTALIRKEVEGYGTKRSVDVVVYDAASGGPIRLIQLLNTPTRELSGTSIALSILRSELHPPTPDAYEIALTRAHSDEVGVREVLYDIDLTECQAVEASRVVGFRDADDETEFVIGVWVFRVYLGEDHGFGRDSSKRR